MVFQPVYHDGDRTIKERWKNLVSFAVAVFRICDLVNALIRDWGKKEVLQSKSCLSQRGGVHSQRRKQGEPEFPANMNYVSSAPELSKRGIQGDLRDFISKLFLPKRISRSLRKLASVDFVFQEKTSNESVGEEPIYATDLDMLLRQKGI